LTSINYFEKTESGFIKKTGVDNPFDGVNEGLFPSPSFGDMDNDGDLDMVIGHQNEIFTYLENTLDSGFVKRDNSLNPFNEIIPEHPPIVAFGSSMKPALGDLDSDGDLDLLLSNNSGFIKHYENTDSGFILREGLESPLGGVDVGSNAVPQFADIDNNGDSDLIIGWRHHLL